MPSLPSLLPRFSPLLLAISLLASAGPVPLLSQESVTSVRGMNGLGQRRTYEGPWGNMETYPILLQPPDTHLWEALFDERSLWSFGPRSKEEALTILGEIGFPTEKVEMFRARGDWSETLGETRVEIDDEIVEALAPEDRAAVSKWFRLNHPVFFGKLLVNLDGGDFSYFENSRLSPATVDLVKRVAFHRRNVLSIIDRPYLLRQIGDDEDEKRLLIRTLFSSRSLIARLVVDETTDLRNVVEYWSAGGQNTGFGPVLQAVRATTGVERLDLIQILPTFPRRYLNGFTRLRDITPTNAPDCFWSSIHFFRESASSRILDALAIEHHLGTDYEVVDEEPRFGDIVCMFNNEDDSFLHSYVHIADEVVFTKNGTSFVRPFVLTTLSDMLSVYLDETAIRYETYRRKPGH